jgi:hypothetical protein
MFTKIKSPSMKYKKIVHINNCGLYKLHFYKFSIINIIYIIFNIFNYEEEIVLLSMTLRVVITQITMVKYRLLSSYDLSKYNSTEQDGKKQIEFLQ